MAVQQAGEQRRPPAPSFEDLLDSAQTHALHLELRDVYAVGEEREVYDTFQRDGSVPADDSAFWSGWLPLVERTVARGVQVRRARIVSEPVTDYIRFEHAITDATAAPTNRSAGCPAATPPPSPCPAWPMATRHSPRWGCWTRTSRVPASVPRSSGFSPARRPATPQVFGRPA
ncbi:DUF6879 family protein [Streptomyces zhihengii]|uniref:DUF6879 domain-containing protein n=1 Tax=Streptomyces zhihengii TaxID=1818004 RepID=A0ABS2V3D9_9ACTN|nr:hypothetical protein [Streptomyces zhihengii]